MSSVELKSSSDDKLSMYEGMVENLVKDESSRYMLDGMFKWFFLYNFSKSSAKTSVKKSCNNYFYFVG